MYWCKCTLTVQSVVIIWKRNELQWKLPKLKPPWDKLVFVIDRLQIKLIKISYIGTLLKVQLIQDASLFQLFCFRQFLLYMKGNSSYYLKIIYFGQMNKVSGIIFVRHMNEATRITKNWDSNVQISYREVSQTVSE